MPAVDAVQPHLPDDLLERCLHPAGILTVCRCEAVCHHWQHAAQRNECWEHLLRSCSKASSKTTITAQGSRSWACREPVGNTCTTHRHLQQLHQTRELRRLSRFIHEFHNGIEVEVLQVQRPPAWYQRAVAVVKASVDILNFWQHESWVLLRAGQPLDEDNEQLAEVEGHHETVLQRTQEEAGVGLRGVQARIRCWEAHGPAGRIGPQYCFLLDCDRWGELFRLPPVSHLEIGSHKIRGHTSSTNTMTFECLMGKWPTDAEFPLPSCSSDVFLFSTNGTDCFIPDVDTDVDILKGLDDKWFEGCRLPDSCILGPTLYASTIDVDLSSWL